MIINSDYITTARRTRRRMRLRILGVLGGILLAASYFFFQARDLIRTPPLVIAKPLDGVSVRGPVVLVEGETAPSIALTINGISIYSEKDGRFRAELLFPVGLHTVSVVAENRLGRTSKLKHQIVVK